MNARIKLRTELRRAFVVGRTSDGSVNVMTIGKHGETITKTVTVEVARELAIELLRATQ